MENLAIGSGEASFGAEHANVQPYSARNANAASSRLCEPGTSFWASTTERCHRTIMRATRQRAVYRTFTYT